MDPKNLEELILEMERIRRPHIKEMSTWAVLKEVDKIMSASSPKWKIVDWEAVRKARRIVKECTNTRRRKNVNKSSMSL